MGCGPVFIKDKRSKPYLMFFIFLKNKILVILILIKDFNKAHFLKGIGGILHLNTPTTPQTKSPNLLRSH
ncbi:hypothetical protein [Helicobacter pylori]|uniref:hypothetical protein n=1 Tax=Helicobacter pylori TaxID=210 RepID=UPI0009A33E90|nr:hypothetical protein [Helicobacter pylori]NHB18220.1 hypothetical protein [Helicobacter pylori]OPG44506.1 hypothetical protein BGL73_02040 [Helicobacter pylori]QEF45625.1 hypothetical protein D2C71_01915 [Helicobacter pylori]